jgi:hypothetical protein
MASAKMTRALTACRPKTRRPAAVPLPSSSAEAMARIRPCTAARAAIRPVIPMIRPGIRASAAKIVRSVARRTNP